MRFRLLSEEQKEYLELRHRYEGDKRVPIVLKKNEGWKNKAIAQALRIHEETVRYYITDWTSDEKLKPEMADHTASLMIPNHALSSHILKKQPTLASSIFVLTLKRFMGCVTRFCRKRFHERWSDLF